MSDNYKLGGGVDELVATKQIGGVHFPKILTAPFDSPSLDAFGRARASDPVTIFESKLLGSDKAPLVWDESAAAGISSSTPTRNKPYTDLTSTNVTADTFVRQTFRRFSYQPGKSQLILITGVIELASGVKIGCQRRIGLFDDDNGIFFASNEGVMQVTVRCKDSGSAVDDVVDQTDWNIDNFSGDVGDDNNPSGIELDWTKLQIFVIDYQWLGAGRVRLGIEIAGIIHYVHQFTHANVVNTPWASTPNLPLRFEMITTTSSGVCSMRAVSAAIISEGGTQNIGIVRHVSTLGAAITTDTENAFHAIIAIRLKATHLDAVIDILRAAIQIQTASEKILWVLHFNPVVADGTGALSFVGLANSPVEIALGAIDGSNKVTVGTHIGGDYAESGGGLGNGSGGEPIHSSLLLGSAIDGTPDIIVLSVMPIGGTSIASIEGSLLWRQH